LLALVFINVPRYAGCATTPFAEMAIGLTGSKPIQDDSRKNSTDPQQRLLLVEKLKNDSTHSGRKPG